MLIFTKFLAFILILLWGLLTITIIIPLVFSFNDRFEDWICGGRQLLTKILQ